MRTIVMTGGTSGFGALAAQRIAPHARLLLGARPMSPPIHTASNHPAPIDTAPLDLASLDAVAAFAEHVGAWLDGSPLDALVLNAGTIGRDVDHRTADGFEHTFAVNHLAHHHLLNLLWHHFAPGATLIATTSGTHDPAEKASLPTPHHADAFRLASPERDPDRDRNPATAAKRAYTASKLCEILTVRTAADRGLTAVAFCPGQTPGTGLVRALPLPLRLAWKLGGPAAHVLPRFNTRADAARALTDLALGRIRPPAGECYAALRNGTLLWRRPSDLACRADVAAALWRDSTTLVTQVGCATRH